MEIIKIKGSAFESDEIISTLYFDVLLCLKIAFYHFDKRNYQEKNTFFLKLSKKSLLKQIKMGESDTKNNG